MTSLVVLDYIPLSLQDERRPSTPPPHNPLQENDVARLPAVYQLRPTQKLRLAYHISQAA